MTRSKLSSKVFLLVGGIGLSMAAFAGSLPATAQSYTCPDGLAYDPSYGCTLSGDYGYYGYPYGLNYGRHFDHRDFGHGFARAGLRSAARGGFSPCRRGRRRHRRRVSGNRKRQEKRP